MDTDVPILYVDTLECDKAEKQLLGGLSYKAF